MKLRDMFPHDGDIVGAIEDVHKLKAWKATEGYAAAPIEVRASVDVYLQRLCSDLMADEEPLRHDENLTQRLKTAAVLRAWLAARDAAARPIQVAWALESELDLIDQALAETVSTDPAILKAQAMSLATLMIGQPLREGMLARNLLAGISEGHMAAV